MRKITTRPVLIGLIILAALAAALTFIGNPRPAPPLPFVTTNFVATSPPMQLLAPPANAPMLTRLWFYMLVTLPHKFSRNKGTVWSFPASSKKACSVQGLLNDCSLVTGNHYLMPRCVAAGVVQFGNASTLNGDQWVSAFEKELQTGDVQFWDSQIKRMRHEHLALLRFAKQKTVVVLPESEVADFLRTNKIQLPP